MNERLTLGRSRSSVVKRLIFLVLVVLSLARVATYWQYTRGPYFRSASDLTQDYVSAKEWLSGRDPYVPLRELYSKHLERGEIRPSAEAGQLNPHPPVTIVLAAPVVLLGLGPARTTLLVAELAAILLAVLLLASTASLGRRTAVVTAAVVLALPVVDHDIRWGQINGLILLAIVTGWRSLVRNKDRRAGLVLGIAAAVKIYPMLFIVPLVRQRRLRAAGWMIGTAAAATLVGLVALGPAATGRWATVASPRNLETWGPAPQSLSLASLPFRLFASARYRSPDIPVAWWVAPAVVGMVILCVLAAARTRAAVTGDLMWATVPWMVLASPIAWPHYLVVVIPVGILFVVRPTGLSTPKRVAALISVALLGIGSSFSSWIVPFNYGYIALGSTVLIGALVCFAVLDAPPASAVVQGHEPNRDDNGGNAAESGS